MANIESYRSIIKDVLVQYLDRYLSRAMQSEIETLFVADDKREVYLILRTGWQSKERIQHILIFVRIVNGRILVEEDWTDFDVVGHLLAAGIPQEEIVLAFHHPSLRPYTEFALA